MQEFASIAEKWFFSSSMWLSSNKATEVYDARARVQVNRASLFVPFETKCKGKRERAHGKTRGRNLIEAIKRGISGTCNDLAPTVRWASDRRMLKPSGGMSAVDIACRHRMLFNSAFITRKTTRRFAIAAGGRVSLRAGFSRTGPPLCHHRFNIRHCELITLWSRCPLNYNDLIS